MGASIAVNIGEFIEASSCSIDSKLSNEGMNIIGPMLVAFG